MAQSTFRRPRTSRTGIIMPAILGVPFATIGTALGYRALSTLLLAWTMQGWPTVQATLQNVELVAESGRTQRVTASYTYRVNGQLFTGKRVSLWGADNLGGFHQRATDELQGYLARGASYPVHVNPKNSSESILMPVVRWEVVAFYLIFVTIFGGAGYGLVIGSYFRWLRIRTEEGLVAQYPDEPWRWRIEWSANRISSSQTSMARVGVALAIFWNVCTWPMVLALPGKLRAEEYVGLLLLIFPLIGLFLIRWAVISVARARRFGATYLVLDTFPARPGEHLRGRVYAPGDLDADNVKVTLICEHSLPSSAAGNRRTIRTETKWSAEGSSKVLRGQSSSGDAMFQVDFALPAAVPETTGNWNTEWFTWRLSANADLKGADFQAGFEVPVFRRLEA